MVVLVRRYGADGVLLWSRDTKSLEEGWEWFYRQAHETGTAGGGRVELLRDGVVVDQVATVERDGAAGQLCLAGLEPEGVN